MLQMYQENLNEGRRLQVSTYPEITSLNLNLIFNLFLDFGGKLLRIVRTFTDESGNVSRNEQVVRDPDVISAYLRVKNSKVVTRAF